MFNQNRLGTVSDEKGFFKMPVFVGDTITFSRIDYEVETIIIEKGEVYSEMIISMQQKIYMLDSVQVLSGIPEPTHLYKQKLEGADIPGITRKVEKSGDDYSTSFGEAVFSPATALYNAFSKKYKEEKEYHELMVEKRSYDMDEERAYEVLEEFLDTQDINLPNEYFEDLLDYCNVGVRWLGSSNDYDIYLRMHSCIQNFVRELPKD